MLYEDIKEHQDKIAKYNDKLKSSEAKLIEVQKKVQG